jgi:hypothetical protein
MAGIELPSGVSWFDVRLCCKAVCKDFNRRYRINLLDKPDNVKDGIFYIQVETWLVCSKTKAPTSFRARGEYWPNSQSKTMAGCAYRLALELGLTLEDEYGRAEATQVPMF